MDGKSAMELAKKEEVKELLRKVRRGWGATNGASACSCSPRL